MNKEEADRVIREFGHNIDNPATPESISDSNDFLTVDFDEEGVPRSTISSYFDIDGDDRNAIERAIDEIFMRVVEARELAEITRELSESILADAQPQLQQGLKDLEEKSARVKASVEERKAAINARLNKRTG